MEYNRMQQVKRRLFAMRNGVVADALRKGGSSFRLIFGLNLPQLREIAAEIGEDKELAMELRNNTSTRESLLLSLLIWPREELTSEELWEMSGDIADREVADLFCHRLLVNSEFESPMLARLALATEPMRRYMAMRLMYRVVEHRPQEIADFARREIARNEPLTRSLALMLLDDAEFWAEESDVDS